MPPPPWGISATLAWLVLAFLVSALVATACLCRSGTGDQRARAPSAYDGVLIAIGAHRRRSRCRSRCWPLAARLRGWPPPDYFALNMPRRGEVIVAVVCVDRARPGLQRCCCISPGSDIVTPFQVEAYRTAKDAGWLFWLLVAIVVVAPIGEEIAFRGFLYRGLARPGLRAARHRRSLRWPGRCCTSSTTGSGWRRFSRSGLTARLVPLGERLDHADHRDARADQPRSHDRNRDQGGISVVSALDPEALGARAYAMIAELAAISAEPDRLVRLFLTPEHRRAADLVAGWMRDGRPGGERGCARHRARPLRQRARGGC